MENGSQSSANKTSVGSRNESSLVYLNAIEWLATVEQQEAPLTKEGLCKTVDTTECGLECCTADTLQQPCQQG